MHNEIMYFFDICSYVVFVYSVLWLLYFEMCWEVIKYKAKQY
jgi:hypothetical protein